MMNDSFSFTCFAVLSHNQFESVSVEKLSQLSKLSVSHNLLRAVPNIQVHIVYTCIIIFIVYMVHIVYTRVL